MTFARVSSLATIGVLAAMFLAWVALPRHDDGNDRPRPGATAAAALASTPLSTGPVREAVVRTSGLTQQDRVQGQASSPTSEISGSETDLSKPVVAPTLRVVTEPPGARVTVNGVGWGTTPVTIRYLPAGPKEVRVTRDGYAAQERTIELAADQPQTTVRIVLRRED